MTDTRGMRAGADEALFRDVNEAIERGRWPGEDSAPATYRCECADRGCTSMLELTPAEYERVRRDPRRFIVQPGHEAPDVERVVQTHPGYIVVEKVGTAARVAEREDPRS